MKMPAIDMHGHFGPCVTEDNPLCDVWWSRGIDLVKSRARDVNIRLTVVSPLRSIMPEGASDPIAGNEEALNIAGDDPEILFWAVLDPTKAACFDQVGELLNHPRCAGIKLHPHWHRYEIADKGDEIFRFAVEHSALLMSHSGDRYSFPESFIPFTNEYPEARLILAHLGNDADGGLERQVRALQQCVTPNVWVDTSSAKSVYVGLVEWAVEELGSDRIVFGSDTPLYSVASQKARIEFAELSLSDKRNILWDNAAFLLGELAPEGPTDERTVPLCTVESDVEAQLVQDALSERDISYTSDSFDAFSSIYFGKTPKRRIDICVFERDLEQARSVLRELRDKSAEGR